MKTSPEPPPKVIARLGQTITLIMLIGVILSILFYSDTYLFFSYTISYSGGFNTFEGNPNWVSFGIFSTSFFIAGLLSFRELFLVRQIEIQDKHYRLWLIALMGVGFFGTAIPHDTLTNGHLGGAFTLLLSVWLLHLSNFKEKYIRGTTPLWFYGLLMVVFPLYLGSYILFTQIKSLSVVMQKVVFLVNSIAGLLLRPADIQIIK